MSVFCFWSQQDSNPRPGYYHVDVLPMRHFDHFIITQFVITHIFFDIIKLFIYIYFRPNKVFLFYLLILTGLPPGSFQMLARERGYIQC